MASLQQQDPALLRRCRSFQVQSTALPSISTSYATSKATLMQPTSMNEGPPSVSHLLSQLTAGKCPSEAPTKEQLADEANTANSSPKLLGINPPPRKPQPNMRRFRSDPDICNTIDANLRRSNPGKITSRCSSESPPLRPLRIPKIRPTVVIDRSPGTSLIPDTILHPPSNSLMMVCLECGAPKPLTTAGQTTTICQLCFKAFKTNEDSQRRDTILTSFPPLLADANTFRDEETEDQDSVRGDLNPRKLSVIKRIGGMFGKLRGGSGGTTGSRRRSESSLESWFDKSSGRSTPARSDSAASWTT